MKISFKILICMIAFILYACSDQEKAGYFGGESSINVPYGEEVLMATWKDDDIWYFTRPMSDDYVPQVKALRQESSHGLYHGVVYFYEHK